MATAVLNGTKRDVENWKRDLVLEAKLDKKGMSFAFQSISLEDIDLAASLKQSGRIDALDGDKVSEYALSMLDGDEFPAVVVQKVGKKYVIVCGNHRCHAAKEAGREEIGAYVISSSDPQAVALFSISDNCDHGLGLTSDAKCLLAIKWVEQFEFSRKEVCSELHLDGSTLSNFLAARKVRNVLSKANVRGAKLSTAQAVALKAVVDMNQKVGVDLARFVVKHNLAADRTRQMAQQIRGGVDEQDMLDRLDKEKERVERILRPKVRVMRAPHRTEFMGAVSRMQGALQKYETFDSAQVTDEKEIQNLRAVLKDIRTKIGVMLNG